MGDKLDFSAVVDPRLNGRTTERAFEAAEARERAYEESLKEDLASEWVLPIGCEPRHAGASQQRRGNKSWRLTPRKRVRCYANPAEEYWNGPERTDLADAAGTLTPPFSCQ